MKKNKKQKIADFRFDIPDRLPLLPVRDIVIYPSMILPLFVGRERSINAVDKALSTNRLLVLAAQKDVDSDDPGPDDIFRMGTVVMIMRMLKLPDGRIKILVQGVAKARIVSYLLERPYYSVKIDQVEDVEPEEKSLKLEALMRNVKEQLEKIISLGKQIPPDILVLADNLDSPGRLADLVISNLGLRVEEAQQVLETLDSEERLRKVGELLQKELELLIMQQRIENQAKEEMTKTQRDYFLREQLKAIQKELGEMDDKAEEIKEFKAKIEKAAMATEVKKEAMKQLRRLEKMHPEAAEATTVRTYLEWLVELPWSISTEDNLDIKKAAKILNKDHYNLEKVKERILEYLSVRKLKQKLKGPILCFVGPPGVGKTSLGKSIARALGRKFIRISLGGVHDEAEIRGHRRTYVGAMPGRIIQGIRQVGSNCPVFMMDEVDKIGADFRGDPAAALLEVLDPEQNWSFCDHYLGVAFDLSNVMFITTANTTDTIPSALKDRMEVIHLSGYTEYEKLKIARKYLIQRQFAENGIDGKNLQISDDSLLRIISQYTREAGLRDLERQIATICRKVARKVAQGDGELFKIEAHNLHRYLGPDKFFGEEESIEDLEGVATGIAWTQAGGEIMHVEVTTMPGKGALALTGQLGEVMKESAQAALSYTRSKADRLGLSPASFSKMDIHIHVPTGATPKDGPSAGVTIATALISALTGMKVRKDVAMTGEITLRGRVLPVGGLKEKILAAKRCGIKHIIIPEMNRRDLEEIARHVKQGTKFILAKNMDDVLKASFKEKIDLDGPVKAKPHPAANRAMGA